MSEIIPVTKDQLFEKKIAENTGSDYNVGDISNVVPVTKDQALLKEIALNSAGQSGDITELEGKVADNTAAIEELTERVSDRYVSVVGDGVKTHQQLMNDLYALVDRSKLTKKSKFGFYYNSTIEWYCSLSFMSADKLQFDGITGGSPTGLMTYHWELSATLADCYRIDYSMTSSGLTINNETMSKPTSTHEYRVYY